MPNKLSALVRREIDAAFNARASNGVEAGSLISCLFAHYELDRSNSTHVDAVLRALAVALTPKSSGAPLIWDDPRVQQLKEHVDALRAANPQLSERRACQLLVRRPAYAGLAASSLRRRLVQLRRTEKTRRQYGTVFLRNNETEQQS